MCNEKIIKFSLSTNSLYMLVLKKYGVKTT